MRTILLLFTIAFSGLTIAQKKASLSGNIQNPKGEKIYLTSYIVESGRITGSIYHDSCIVKNGKFNLTAKLDSLTLMYFWHGNEHGWVYMKPREDLYITLNTNFFDETTLFEGDGADRNNAMTQITVVMKNMKLNKNILYEKFKNDQKNDTIYLFDGIAKIDSIFYDFIDSQIILFPELKEDLEYVKKRNSSISKGYIKPARKHIEFVEIQKKESGAPFLDEVGIDLDGNEAKISDFYGKLTVLDFWATWCIPCIKEFPGLHELEKKFDGKVTFVGIGSSCKIEDWIKKAKEEGFKNNIYLDKENMDSLSEKYSIHAIPRYIILDANGNVLNLDAERPSSGLEDQLNELLK